MCRWLAYSGESILLERLMFDPHHSLIDQSLNSSDSEATTNGDGFGIGWYDEFENPGLYKHIQPAWNDPNLRDLCGHVMSPMFLAHVRSATGSSGIQQTNCHPFRHGNWLFMHNGSIRGFDRIKREIACEVSDQYYPEIRGTTDSELMFLLALTFGLESEIRQSLERMVGLVESLGFSKGTQYPIQMTLGIADGDRMYAVRYSSERNSKTLFHSRSIAALRELAPPSLIDSVNRFSEDARAIVSEPLTALSEPWKRVPESTFLTVENGDVHYERFEPEAP
ncbi:class II glutamine amidotransferase [Bacteroidota bacterium]